MLINVLKVIDEKGESASGNDKSGRVAEPRDAGKQAEIAFRLYDKDKDGYITKSEMEKLSKTLTKEQIDKAHSVGLPLLHKLLI